ncbi:MAG: serine hydrolase domain-containing protein [Bryobacteraceae bacterium]
MRIDRQPLGMFLMVLLPLQVLAQFPRAKPEEVGISSERLGRIREQMKLDVERKVIPGGVLLIARNGKIAALDTAGFQNRKVQTPMKTDTIFRIASMSKPIVSVAAMILSEEGKLDIGAPVAQYLPEFKDVKVGAERVAPKRAMTVQDLLRHTSGLTYGIFGSSPVDAMYQKSGVLFASKSLKAMVETIASFPLLHQPGEAWEYSVSTDVLGRVVEVASGMELDKFVATRITDPLKMPDTGFYLTKAQAARLAIPDAMIALPPGDITARPAVLSGGGGMLSTAGDYARFCQMLLNGGELDGVRILAPHTVALMTSDQLPPGIERHTPVAIVLDAFGPTAEMGTGFGLGFAVRTSAGRNPVPGSVGDFSWAGIAGTFFWVDPKEKLVAVLMIQVPQLINVPYWRQTRTLVYQALLK